MIMKSDKLGQVDILRASNEKNVDKLADLIFSRTDLNELKQLDKQAFRRDPDCTFRLLSS